MATQRTGRERANALRRNIPIAVEEACGAPAEAVYDLLADLPSHLVWGGERQGASTRLLELRAPGGPAAVGTEFESVGADPMGRFTDRSVVTEASRPGVFEFVTEARLETKRSGPVDWTLVHRFEITPESAGCRIAYTGRVTRISRLPGMLALFRVPGLRALGAKAAAGVSRRGVRNLARLAEERAGV